MCGAYKVKTFTGRTVTQQQWSCLPSAAQSSLLRHAVGSGAQSNEIWTLSRLSLPQFKIGGVLTAWQRLTGAEETKTSQT